MSRAKATIGIDLGGTRMRVGRFDDSGVLRAERTASPAGAPEGVARLAELARELAPEGIARVGISAPGPLDFATGIIRPLNMPGWHDYPLVEELRQRLGAAVVAIDNDANVAALSEWAFGAGRHASDLVMLTLGTGVGGGVVVADRLYRGWAELGHLVVEHDGKPCQGACTGRGHVESYCTGVAAAEAARDAFGSGADSRRLVELADQGDERARGILTDIGRRLGSAIGSLVNVFDPQVVAVGGGFGVAAFRFLAGPAREIAEREALAGATFEIVPAELGTRAGLIGAGLVAFEALPSGA